jgi:hypothetical protein
MSDRTFTTESNGSGTGTVFTGTRAGQKFTVDNFLSLVGLISRDHERLTLASAGPTAELFPTVKSLMARFG